jgi:hypothetical protein
VPILGALMCALLLMSLMGDPATRDFFLVYLLLGTVFYFVYGIWNSKLRPANGNGAASVAAPERSVSGPP